MYYIFLRALKDTYILLFNDYGMMCYRPTTQPKSDKDNVITVAGQSYVDTEAGFLLNEDELLDKNKPV